jgi:hypothetical protein
MHAVNVLGAGFHPHEDDLAARLRGLNGFLGVNTISPVAAPGDAGSPEPMMSRSAACGSMVGCRSWSSEAGVDPHDRFLSADQPLAGHVDGNLECRLGRALARPGLQHPQLAVLNGKFQILHVAVMVFQPVADGEKLGKASGISFSSDGRSEPASMRAASVIDCGVRMPATTSSP